MFKPSLAYYIVYILLVANVTVVYPKTAGSSESAGTAAETLQKKSVRIASCSIYPKKWDKAFNWKQIHAFVTRAAEAGAEVVVTPEGVLEGYVINQVNEVQDPQTKAKLVQQFVDLGEPLHGPYIRKARALADDLSIYLVMGFLEKKDDLLFNSAVLIDPEGNIAGLYRKTHFAQGYTINPSCYQPGNEYPVFDTPFGKVGMMICYDRQLPEPARILALKGARILLAPSYGSYGEDDGWNTILLRTRAYENRCALVFSHPNQSLMIDTKGRLVAKCGANDIIMYTVDTDPMIVQDRFKNRRPTTYSELIQP